MKDEKKEIFCIVQLGHGGRLAVWTAAALCKSAAQ